MVMSNRRLRFFVLMHAVLIGLVPATKAPSDPMALTMFENAPDAEELAFFEELGEWIREEPEGVALGSTIRERSASFDMFRRFHTEDVRYRPLETLPFGDAIRHAADLYDIDAFLIAAVIEAESSFDPQAISRQGAMGLMQVMPTTYADLDVDDLRDPLTNIDHGTRYLQVLIERFGGDLELALAAYNAGPGNVRRYGGVPPFRETRRYVEKVLDLYVDHHREVWQDTETGELLASI